MSIRESELNSERKGTSPPQPIRNDLSTPALCMTSVEDCFFFLNGKCNKGSQCTFRHSEAAKTSFEMCPEYLSMGQCSQLDCGMRHSRFHLKQPPAPQSSSQLQADPEKTVCFFERVKGACTRDSCPFKHFKKINVNAPVFVPSYTIPAPPDASKYDDSMQECKANLAKIKLKIEALTADLNSKFEKLQSTAADLFADYQIA